MVQEDIPRGLYLDRLAARQVVGSMLIGQVRVLEDRVLPVRQEYQEIQEYRLRRADRVHQDSRYRRASLAEMCIVRLLIVLLLIGVI